MLYLYTLFCCSYHYEHYEHYWYTVQVQKRTL